MSASRSSNKLVPIKNWLKKASVYTFEGALVGASLGTSTALIAGTLVKGRKVSTAEAYRQTLLASSTGSAIIGGSIGFLEATPFSLTQLINVIFCGEPVMGLYLPLFIVGLEVAGTELGRAVLTDTVSFSASDGAFYAILGSVGTMGLLLLIGCTLACFPECVDSIQNLFDALETWIQSNPEASQQDQPAAVIDIEQPAVTLQSGPVQPLTDALPPSAAIIEEPPIRQFAR